MLKTKSLRHWHRRLGVFIGMQFLLWTASGIYFAWTDIDDIHGDHLRQSTPVVAFDSDWISPAMALDQLGPDFTELAALDVVHIDDDDFYQLHSAGTAARTALVDVRSGELRDPLDESVATRMAKAAFAPDAEIRSVELLTDGDVGPHHEYRGNPLPAWRFEFDHGSGAHVYVSADGGQVTKLRTRDWRIFDFLWMLHTMDYVGRDDINNPLLRGVALFGLLLTLSGFWLLVRTRRRA